jgi:hypothetical protein
MQRPLADEVYTVEWLQEAKEFRVVKVPRPRQAGWGRYENYWDAYAVMVRWNEALRRHYNNR